MSIGSIGEGKQHRKFATTQQAADYLGVSTAFLEKDRVTGTHQIPFVKLGRLVRYDLTTLDHVMADRTRLNTSEPHGAE
jgi:excisionase family DNA binding protein